MSLGKASRPLSVLIPAVSFILAIVISATVSITFYAEEIKRLGQNKLNELALEAELLDAHFQTLLSQSAQDVLFLSNTPPIQSLVESQEEESVESFEVWSNRLDVIFKALIQVKPLYQQLRFIGIDSDGKELVSSLRRHFTVYRAPDAQLGRHIANSDFQKALSMKKGEVYFSSIQLNQFEGKTVLPHQPVMYILTPIFDDNNGQLFGVIALSLLIDPFLESLEQFDNELILSNERGDYLYHPVLEKRYAFDLNHEENLFSDFPALKPFATGTNVTNKFSELEGTNDESYSAYFKPLLIDKYGTSPPINLLLVSNKNAQKESLSELRDRSLIIGGALALFALVLAIIASNRITRPLTRLSNAVSEFENTGVLGVLPIESKDEVGVFSRGFLSMMQRIDTGMNELKEQKFALDQHSIVSITDTKGTITYANDRFCEISGYDRDELIGSNHRLLKSGHHPIAFFIDMYKSVANGGVWQGEICNLNKSGEIYWVKSTIVASKNLEGKPQSYVAIRTDITERKLAEVELLKAKEFAEETASAKSEFLASMSHEIRTPMNGVLGMLGLLLNTNLNQEQQHRAKIAESSAQSLLTLINDILDFSKIEAGKLDLEMLSFNLPTMVGGFADSMAQMAQVKGLELILDTTRVSEAEIIGDPGRIRQILTNLVSNSIKFTKEGEVIIRAGLHEYDHKHWLLEFQVKDTGIGIPEDKQSKLFDAFSQVDASTTREFGGTGLGLSIVKQLCRLMQGDVTVESNPSVGSAFKCTMVVEKTKQPVIKMPRVEIKHLNILVVDDNATNLEVLHQQLISWGASVTEAQSGQEALDICAERVECDNIPFFDLAILDMKMPNMSGAELGEALLSNPQFKGLKLVMMTSMNFQGDAKKLAELGFSAYFPKPATASDLYNAINVVADDGEALAYADPLVTQHNLKVLVSSEGAESSSWPAKTRILLVEDNQINQLVATTILKEKGLLADVAANGVEAINSLMNAPADAPYTLVLMDCQMPEMDGYEASRGIRAGDSGERNIDIPIIAMTANAMQGDKEKCLEAGMSDYLSKPMNAAALVEKLQKWLNKRDVIVDSVTTIDGGSEPSDQVSDGVWEKAEVLERIGGKEDFLVVLINNFLQDKTEKLGDIKQAYAADNFSQIRELSHSVKGVAGQLAGKKLMTVSAELEANSKAQNKVGLGRLIEQFEEAYLELTDIFEHHLEQYSQNTCAASEHDILSVDELNEKLVRIERMLRKSDYISPDELTFMNHGHQEEVIQNSLKTLKKQISQFDNTSALSTLTGILKHTNANLEQQQ